MSRTGPIKITFLGTGTSIGVPVIACNCPVCKSTDPRDKRFRTSALINVDNQNIVIDCGPDFRFQMLKQNVEDIDAVIFTHEHRDHIAGLDDVRAFNYILNKNIPIYGSVNVMEAIKTEFPYIFTETRYFGVPQLTIHEIDAGEFSIGPTKILPVNVLHNKLPVFGYRIGGLTYITDASMIPEEEKHKIFGSEVLVLNALRNSKHISHLSLSEALLLIEELKPGRAYLTHISHFLGLHNEVEKKLPENVHLAYDNLIVEIP
ncbi:Ribonuclease BN [bioreactor metagenome]|jgi:phosphoribosyl 1,2-cyclic phosphate phosphodiesterase|uniref:Ribonuclease BN n=1 Tax=bioreactor metagenome TaxID=1076179 RepID=A0A644TZF7_9ZZZZ